jgi:hypothetical protein
MENCKMRKIYVLLILGVLHLLPQDAHAQVQDQLGALRKRMKDITLANAQKGSVDSLVTKYGPKANWEFASSDAKVNLTRCQEGMAALSQLLTEVRALLTPEQQLAFDRNAVQNTSLEKIKLTDAQTQQAANILTTDGLQIACYSYSADKVYEEATAKFDARIRGLLTPEQRRQRNMP